MQIKEHLLLNAQTQFHSLAEFMEANSSRFGTLTVTLDQNKQKKVL